MSWRAVLVGAAVVVVAAGCGGHSQRSRVASYLQLVDATETKVAKPLKAVTKANQAFAKQHAGPRVDAQLVTAQHTLESLRRKLAAIRPPSVARKLHRLLLELLGHEIELAHEVYGLATFAPKFEQVLRPLTSEDASLKSVLARSAKGVAATKALDARKALALTGYADELDLVLGRLRLLEPPPVWQPAYATQVSTLMQLRDAARALAAGIAANRAPAIPALLRRFDAAAAAGQSVAAQRRQDAAIEAYDRRVRTLVSLSQAIQRERNRLQRTT